MHAVRKDPNLKRFYPRKRIQKGLGKARMAAARKLGNYPERGIVMLPASHRFASRRSVKLSELSEDLWIVPTRDQSPVVHDVFLAECHKSGFAPKINVAADWYARFPLVASGAGVCVGASSLLKFRRPKIKFVPIEPSVTVDMGMITNREDHCPQLDEFRGLVQEALSLRESEMRA